MQIRQEQIQSMILHDEEKFVEFIANHLKKESKDKIVGIPNDLLVLMIKNGVTRARSHGLSSPGDLSGFLSLMFEVAPNFDEHPVFKSHLNNPRVAQEQRFDRMLTMVPDQAWEEASQRYDETAWFPELKGKEDLNHEPTS